MASRTGVRLMCRGVGAQPRARPRRSRREIRGLLGLTTNKPSREESHGRRSSENEARGHNGGRSRARTDGWLSPRHRRAQAQRDSEREVVDLQQGDYEEMDQLAIAKPLCKAAFRVLHAADIGIGVARAIRASVSGRPGGVYLDLPAKLFAQVIDAEAGAKSLVKVVEPAPAQLPAPAAVKRALDVLKSAKRPLIILGKGAAYAQADDAIRALVETSGIPFLQMSMAKGLLPVAVCRRGAIDGAQRLRRGHDDRRAPQLAAVARQGQDLG